MPIVTGEAVALDLRPARLPSRLLAVGIDLIVEYTALLLLIWLVALVLLGTGGFDSAASVALLLTCVVACMLGYPVLMGTLAGGRTLGKIALGLRVVRADGGPVLFRQVLVREIVGLVVEKPGPLLGLPAVVVALAREDGRRLGDLAAGTMVVSERVTGRPVPPPQMPPGLQGWAASLDLSRLPDAAALRARSLLARADQMRPDARETLGRAVVAEVSGAVGAPPPGVPGWAFLAAVLAERRRRDGLRLAERARVAARVPGVPGSAASPGRPVGMAAYDGELTP